ncbi:DUF6174 domain-containing protein [Nocardioides stalactiti]|uniref:DUF6174 domain-containing protein n=1 Tax=Nocardioides stalactiti TaxID=2755356 RepID=UPI0016007CCF|nr:DUF6174 domain-containing protein [Nocardioides stalactiti]
MKILLSAAAAALTVTVLTGCSGDGDDGRTAEDPATTPAASEPTDPPTVGTYPDLEAGDYTFTLEQQCFCPLTGPTRITVEDGVVTEAVLAEGGHGLPKGSDAPQYLRVTINDVIARANDTDAASVDVTWPDGQDWPDSVAVDQIEMATDDEITYVISDVQIAG